uniref:Rapamycin-insensitive companion of mTOR N-terminal domain-containing protein n=2 Tax=Meloidogyne enterolobii TaxID=390850 RepID=A0A6V7VYD4_MELEN|nr:unnamed protein product [Meloidogyne enterolobii]
MKAGKLEKEDLQKLKQIKRNAVKCTHENVKEKVYESFTSVENFLEFINNWENISDGDDLLIFLFRILSTLENQNIFIANSQIYEALFKRSFNTIKFHIDPKICEISFLIVSKICNTTVRIIQAIQSNFDIFLFRYIYTLNPSQYNGETQALHFLSVSFSVLLKINLFDPLLINWWRFRFFLQNSINCLMDIAFGQNSPFSLSNEQKTQNNSDSIKDCVIQILSAPKGLSKNLQISSIGILLELLVQRPELLFEMNIGLNWFIPTINQSALGTVLINILCKWLDSPIIREKCELKFIVEQLFCPFISFDSIHDSSAKIDYSHSTTLIEICKNSLFNLLITWPGLFTFFSNNSSNRNLFAHIGCHNENLNSDKIKCCTIELFSNLLNVPYARHEFLDNHWEKAFFFYKQIRLPDLFSISLRDDFLLAEVSYLDNQKDDSFIDLLEIYRSVVLFKIVCEKFPEALIRLILQNPDCPISIKATFLLADILYMSKILPKSVRIEAINNNNLINSVVESFNLNENISNKDEKKRNSFLLIDRLNEVNNFLNKPTKLEFLTLINTFLIVNLEEFRRSRSVSILNNSRHSSTTAHFDDCNNNVNETFSEEPPTDSFDSNIDKLISNVFITQPTKKTKIYKNINVPEIAQQKLKKNDFLEDSNEYLMENIDWNIFWRILSFIDDKIISFQNKSTIIKSTIDKCIPIFNQIFYLFLPLNQFFIQNKPSIQLIKCGQYFIQLLCLFNSSTFVGNDNSQWALNMLSNFINDFSNQINMDKSEAVFSSKNLLFGGSSFYFALLRALLSQPFGQKLFDQTGLGQMHLYFSTNIPSFGSPPVGLQ